MAFKITTKVNVVGKPSGSPSFELSLASGPYEVREFASLEQLVAHSYYDGRAFTGAVVDVARFSQDLKAGLVVNGHRTPRNYDYFVSSQLLIVDVDKPTDASYTLEYLLSRPWATNVGCIFPSSSYTPENPRWHLVFLLSEPVTDHVEYGALAQAFYAQIDDIVVDPAMHVAVQPVYGTVFTRWETQGKPKNLVYVNEDARLDLDWLRSLPSYSPPEPDLPEEDQHEQARRYDKSEEGSARTKKHREQPPEAQERAVLDALSYLLPTFSRETSYSLWLQTWMAAHDGAPTTKVRDYILQHPAVYWRDGAAGKKEFAIHWANHTPREGGFTVASLFWLASRRGGWLKNSPFDVPDEEWELITVERISQWAEKQEELPKRCALHAQTGSGKTYWLSEMYRRLGAPKTLVIVPTMKLAEDMTATLVERGVPATLYFDPNSRMPLDGQELSAAQVLVSTLQTFSKRVFSGDMSHYGLVYVEESDQLISQFVRGASVFSPSHVREEEARAGLEMLRVACEQSGYVWFVDATMTRLTVSLAQNFCPPGTLRLVRNTHVKRKSPVVFLESVNQGYNVAIHAIIAGKRVVVAADTKAKAREFFKLLQVNGITSVRRTLLITKDTEKDPAVIEFMLDANRQARRYDVVIYNSVMASGVSITEVKPDVLVQLTEYLTPRANLQMLNRYRQQAEVYCYVGGGERLYSDTAEEIIAQAKKRVEIELALLGLPYMPRSDVATLRADLAAIATADEHAQQRNPYLFYRQLLASDGRSTSSLGPTQIIEEIAWDLEEIRRIEQENKDFIRENWPTVRPISQSDPPDPGMSLLDIALGTTHNHIVMMLNGPAPQADPGEVYDIVKQFGPRNAALTAFATQDRAYATADRFMSDPDAAINTYYNDVTMLQVVSLLLPLWGDDFQLTRTAEELAGEPGQTFLRALAEMREEYDTLMPRSRDKYTAIRAKHGDSLHKLVLTYSKALLNLLGFKLRSNGHKSYAIDNLEQAELYLSWQHRYTDPNFRPDFSGRLRKLQDEQFDWASRRYQEMTEIEKAEVQYMWSGDQASFFLAVKHVLEEDLTKSRNLVH